MTSCSWTPGTRWVKDRRCRLSGLGEWEALHFQLYDQFAVCFWKGPCAAVSPFPLLGLHFCLCRMGVMVPTLLNSIK